MGLMEMNIAQAQRDMRDGYGFGGPGILASALAWACSAGGAAWVSAHAAVWTLLVGGMLIFPVSILFCRLLGARGSHSKGNPFGELAGASTFWLIFASVIALVLSWQHPAWFFPAMLLTIGGRYLVFATAYGMKLYWLLGLLLAAAGVATFVLSAPAGLSAALGAVIEAGFAVVCISRYRHRVQVGDVETS